ncbi:YjfB family protein [Marinobacter lacisalsi]|uniref:YjfB family protein n=1 Tax=Marinobacter lacisalsi TaxID=475979 RepID=A0ABV8QBA1_9GAMM
MSDVASMAAASTQMSQQRVSEQAQIQVMKQAMDMQQQGAMQLLESVTDTAVPTASANPADRVGTTIDVKA